MTETKFTTEASPDQVVVKNVGVDGVVTIQNAGMAIQIFPDGSFSVDGTKYNSQDENGKELYGSLLRLFLMPSRSEIERLPDEWSIWHSEGKGGAVYWGKTEAHSFEEACTLLAKKYPKFKGGFDPDTLTWSGHSLHHNQKEAMEAP